MRYFVLTWVKQHPTFGDTDWNLTTDGMMKLRENEVDPDMIEKQVGSI